MTNPEDPVFYTYAWLRENGTPYYIGKGCGRRAYIKRKWKPPKDRILILKRNLTESQAQEHEKYMIFIFGRKHEGGILYNVCEGGETGRTGIQASEETRRKMSETRKGKALAWPDSRPRTFGPEAKANMAKGQVGRVHPPEVRAKISESLKKNRNEPTYLQSN